MPVRKYLVVCSCSGSIDPLAYLNDDRPSGGLLQIEAAPGKQGQVGILNREGPAPLEGQVRTAEQALSEVDVTEIFWPNGNVQWSIRCAGCNAQAQMSAATYAAIADELASNPGPVVEVPALATKIAASGELRHVVQLRALCARLGRQGC